MADKEMLSSSAESVESPLDSPSLSPIHADDKKHALSSTRSSSLSTDSDHSDFIHVDHDGLDTEKQLSRHTSRVIGEQLVKTQTGFSVATHMTTDVAFEVDWEEDDKGNPQNWPAWRKALTLFCISYSTMTV
jgi:hypothetical protein